MPKAGDNLLQHSEINAYFSNRVNVLFRVTTKIVKWAKMERVTLTFKIKKHLNAFLSTKPVLEFMFNEIDHKLYV